MAAKETVWNIEVEGVQYKIEFVKNQIIINNRKPIKLGSLKKSGNSWVETHYSIPFDGKEAVLHVRQFSAPILSFEGKDCSTGEEYLPLKVPGWAWVFIVLHALDFLLLIGGAIGGALQAFVISMIIAVSANQQKKTGVRVAACAGIWILSSVVQFIVAFMILSLEM